MTVAIILTDVAHNLWFVAAHPLRGSFVEDVTSEPFLLSQVAFLLFVSATARMAGKGRADLSQRRAQADAVRQRLPDRVAPHIPH